MCGKETGDAARPLRLTEPSIGWGIGEEVVNGVITAAVMSVGQRPGVWQRILRALRDGADKTEEGTVNAFLFQAMVDRLLEEFHALEKAEGH